MQNARKAEREASAMSAAKVESETSAEKAVSAVTEAATEDTAATEKAASAERVATGREGRKTTTEEMRHKTIIAWILLLAVAAGCKQPVNDYSYINLNRLKGWEGETALNLHFDMVDTTGACELYIAGEIVVQRTTGEEKGYPINLTFIAPDSTSWEDSVFLPLNVKRDSDITITSHGIKSIEWPYRKNIHNPIPGEWTVIITKGDSEADYSDIVGLGIYCKQQKP
jgi:hypothetical protein